MSRRNQLLIPALWVVFVSSLFVFTYSCIKMSSLEDTCGKMFIEMAQGRYELKSFSVKIVGWAIDNVSLNNKQVGEYLTSPTFHDAFNATWKMKLYPKGVDEECQNHVSFFLQLVHGSVSDETEIMVITPIDRKFIGWNRIDGAAFKAANNIYGIKQFFEYDLLVRHMSNDKDGISSFMFTIKLVDKRDYKPFHFDTVLNNTNYSDVKFRVEGKDIYAHKVLLANKSNVFAAMFEHEMKENLEGIVEINDIEYDVVLAMFNYIYTGNIIDTDNFAKPLLIVADKYEIVDLKEICSKYLEKHLNIENIKDCLDLAVLYNASSLKHEAIDFIKSNASNISETNLKLMIESQPDIIVEVIHYLSKQAKIVSK